MTTPEQLQAWREDAEAAWLNDPFILRHEGAYSAYKKGYLRAKQETEQEAVKELQNIANAKRFDREAFPTNDDFCQWAQSRARFTLEKIGATK